MSRGYILGLSVFFVVVISEKILRKTIFFTKRAYFLLILIGINILLLSFSIYFINHIEITNNLIGREDLERITSLNDKSNFIRFTANAKMLNLLNSDFYTTLFGLREQSQEYLIEQLRYTVDHNAILRITVFRGVIFVSFYLMALGRIIRRLYSLENLKYILSLIFFSLFLHTGYQDVGLIFFIATLALPELTRNKKNRKKVTLARF